MLGLWLLLGLSACLPKPSAAQDLRLSAFRQDGDRNVYLNEPLVLDFSEDLDPLSITESRDGESGSLRVLDPNGLPVPGTLSVNARQILFQPRLPLLPDLSDGGFRPGSEYRVLLAGFPRPDGLRSLQGAPLERSLALGFRTALASSAKPLFDPFLELGGGPARMLLENSRLAPSDPITIVGTHGVDPRSLSGREFALTPWDDLEAEATLIALHPRLVLNQGRTERGREEYLSRLELVPERALGIGRYVLTRVEHRLQSLDGQTFLMPVPIQGLQIEIAPAPIGRRVISFRGAQWSHYDEAPGSDGTLLPAADGAGLSLRLLAAAGSGADGELQGPEAWQGDAEPEATGLRLESGSELELSERKGCVVLRAQGRMILEGRLRRRLGSGIVWSDAQPFSAGLEPGESQAAEASMGEASANPRTLDAWLERMQQLGEPWTVLIAGGDLVISGEIDVEGPLMLIAGGVIRVPEGGLVRAQAIYKSREGGDNIGRVLNAPLALLPASVNGLAEGLVYGLLTRPFRPQGGVRAWLSASVEAELGSASLGLQFIGLRDLPGGGTTEVGPVAKVDQLLDCQGIRLLVFLSLPAADEQEAAPGPAPWVPPLVRQVTLEWAPAR